MNLIKTKNFILRDPEMRDAEDVARYLNDRAVTKHMASIAYPYTPADAKDWIRKCRQRSKENKEEGIRLVIELDGEVVGGIGAHAIKPGHKAEFGYWLGRKHWGKGIMTEAVKIFADHLFKKFKLKRIQARVYEPNVASGRVLEKCGFKCEGFMLKEGKKGNRLLNTYIYAKIK